MDKTAQSQTVADEVWLRSCKTREEWAWQRLVKTHHGSVYRLSFRRLRKPDEAEDATQETFIRAYRYFETFQEGASLLPWLLRICYHNCLKILKDREIVLNDEPLQELSDLRPTAEDTMVREERKQRLESLIFELPPAWRAVVTLRHLDGLDYQQIAEVLDLPLGTVKTNLYRARERLSKLLSREQEG